MPVPSLADPDSQTHFPTRSWPAWPLWVCLVITGLWLITITNTGPALCTLLGSGRSVPLLVRALPCLCCCSPLLLVQICISPLQGYVYLYACLWEYLEVHGLEDPHHNWKTTPSRSETSHFLKYEAAQTCQKIEPPPLFLDLIFTHHDNFAVKFWVVLVIGVSEEIPYLLHHPLQTKHSTKQTVSMWGGQQSPSTWKFCFPDCVNQQWRSHLFQALEEGPIKTTQGWKMLSAFIYAP